MAERESPIFKAAYLLRESGKGLGWPRNPARVPEVNATLRGLESGSEIASDVFRGYLRGWDAACA